MLQNQFEDISEVAYVKHIGDRDDACGKPPLRFESYLELLFSACSAYVKNHAPLSNPRFNVYASMIAPTEEEESEVTDALQIFYVDNGTKDIIVYSSTTRPLNNVQKLGSNKVFKPRDE